MEILSDRSQPPNAGVIWSVTFQKRVPDILEPIKMLEPIAVLSYLCNCREVRGNRNSQASFHMNGGKVF